MAKKVLVVDDDANLVTYLQTLLEDNGYSVVTANNGDEGLKKAGQEHPDAITLDLLMPEKSGIKMFRELRKDDQLKSTPIVVITGIASEYEAFSNFKKFIYERKIPGPEAYLEKPVNPEELLAKLKELLS